MPILRAHQGIFITSLVLSFVGLVLQVQIPDLLNHAIDNSVQHHTVPLHFYVWWILGLGLAGGVAGYVSRLFLFQTAYEIEYDLRTIIYEHLTRMSFPFYDRVQSGQLISRANSDIRSVQMYMTFAPMILVQCSIAVVAFGFMLSINVPLAFVAMATMPFVFLVGHRMRKSMFPVSWLIQARLADVATIVDENVNGVRVVRSFAAEKQQLRTLAKAADKVQWGYVKDADLRARWTPAVQNLPQVGLALVLAFGGYMVIHGTLGLGAILAFNSYLLMLQAPFMMLGMIIMMGQRAAASAERIYEILDEQPTIVDRPGAVDLVDCKGDVRFEKVGFSYGPDLPMVLSGLDLHLRPGETVALVGRTGSGKSTVARLIPRFYDVTEGRFAGGRPRRSGPDHREPAVPTSASCSTMPSCSRCRSGTTSPTGAPTPTSPTWRRRRAPRGPTPSSGSCPRATTPWWESGATRCRGVSASASPSPGPCSSTRPSWSSTTPPAPSTSRWSSRSTTPCACSWKGAPR